MIQYKTDKEIETMIQGGTILKKIYTIVKKMVVPGISTIEIDNEIQQLIKENEAEISFNKVPGYQWASCLTINEQVVHTPPSSRKVQNGDVLTIDMGVYYKGFHVDFSDTFIVGDTSNKETIKFLNIGRETLNKAIAILKNNMYIGEISQLIEREIEGNNYYVMHELTGHGVGRELHEDPLVPGYLESPINKTPKFKNGMVIAIEVIYSMGTREIADEEGDDWSIVTLDGSLSACFEHSIAMYKNRPFILT